MFTRTCQCFLSWGWLIQTVVSYAVTLRSIVILFCRLCLGLPSCTFSCSSKPLSHICHLPLPWHDRPNDIWWGMRTVKLISVLFSPASTLARTIFRRMCSSHNASDQVSHSWETTQNCTFQLSEVNKFSWKPVIYVLLSKREAILDICINLLINLILLINYVCMYTCVYIHVCL